MVHQNKDVNLDVIHKLIEGLEVDYIKGGSDRKKCRGGGVYFSFIYDKFEGGETLKIVLAYLSGYR